MNSLHKWSGNIDDLANEAVRMLRNIGRADQPDLTIRLVRDYMQRGLLGGTIRRGRELVFDHRHLMRLVAARVLLADGWPLSKIKEHFDVSSAAEIEALVPGAPNRALDALERIRQESASLAPRASSPSAPPVFSRRAAKLSVMQGELQDAMRKLGLPPDGIKPKDVTMITIATWCFALVDTDRLRHLTIDEAEEIGRVLTASLLSTATRKGKP